MRPFDNVDRNRVDFRRRTERQQMTEPGNFTPASLIAAYNAALWDRDIQSFPIWRRRFIWVVRLFYVIFRDLRAGQITLRAMGLVYTTLLSIVPVIAVSFSVLKGFGVHNQIEPLLLGALEPLGERAEIISAQVITFVDNLDVGVLGFVGLGFLFYTVISLMQKIETSINFIWHVETLRTLSERFRDYLSVLVIGPVLVFASLGITASIAAVPLVEAMTETLWFGNLAGVGGRVLAYLMVASAFAFIYAFMPNAKVRLRSAIIGGLVAGLLWNIAGWGFASFVVSSGNYAAIYSSFATLVLFLIWLYLSWLILLLGASIAFYDNHPEFLARNSVEVTLSNRVKEKLALFLLERIGVGFVGNDPPHTASSLAEELNMPSGPVASVLQTLEDAGLLARTGKDQNAFLPAMPMENIALGTAIRAIRQSEEAPLTAYNMLPPTSSVDQVMARMEDASRAALDNLTLKDLTTRKNG